MSSSDRDDPAGANVAGSHDAERLAADTRAAAFGRVIALLMASARHANMTLTQVQTFVAPAVALDQMAILGRQGSSSSGPDIAAAVWWAMVSAEVDERLTHSREPHLALAANEWRCGDQPWIVETIGNGDVINELLRRLAEHAFIDKPAKLRAHLPDGRIAVGRIERKPSEVQQTNT